MPHGWEVVHVLQLTRQPLHALLTAELAVRAAKSAAAGGGGGGGGAGAVRSVADNKRLATQQICHELGCACEPVADVAAGGVVV